MDDLVREVPGDQACVKFNLGAGGKDQHLEGFVNLDINQGNRIYPLDCEDNSASIIRASHVLEHFPHGQTQEVLNHWADKLAPGGVLQIAVPDFAYIVRQYIDRKALPLEGYLMGGQVDDHDYHQSVWDTDKLKAALYKAGLERICTWESEQEDCAALPVSLNLQGYKPLDVSPDYSEVCAVLSAPRFAPTMHAWSTAQSFGRLGIDYYPMQGAYWHQVLSEVLDKVRDRYEYIITTDYDSAFTGEDVTELLRLMMAYPEIHALFPLQYKRNECSFLGQSNQLVTPYHLGQNVVQMKSGHFGLTVLRSEALAKAKKPWFLGMPDGDGGYGEGKTDADIWFWRNWAKFNCTVYMATKVRIGHMQEMIVWPGDDYQPVYQSVSDFQKRGPPPAKNR